MSTRHKEAMAHLSYGLTQGGCFIVLTGEVGTGKTTLCRNLLSELPDDLDVALILNANINESELLQTICDELKIAYDLETSQKQLLDNINKYLLDAFANNRHTVLIIDEAQLLSRDVLEQIRLLTNLETTKAKLLQIILIGQPELNELLSRNDLRQLTQRITARYHLGALRKNEIEEYVNFRLGVAGCKKHLFTRQALNSLYSITDGIPRKINVLADHALLAAYSHNEPLVDAKIVKTAAQDVFIQNTSVPVLLPLLKKWALPLGLLLLLNVGLWWFFSTPQQSRIEVVSHDEPVNSPANIPEVVEQIKVDSTTDEPEIIDDSATNQVSEVDSPTLQSTTTVSAASDVPGVSAQLENQDLNSEEIQPGIVVVSDEYLDDSPNLPAGLELPGLAAQVTNAETVNDGRSNQATGLVAFDGGSDLVEDSGLVKDSSLVDDSGLVEDSDSVEDSGLVEDSTYIDSSLGLLLETSADVTGRINAFRSLAKVWQRALPESFLQSACEVVGELGLRCLGFSEWRTLMTYNRPAIIVIGHKNQLHRVIVRAVNQQSALIVVGDREISVEIAELKSRWNKNGVLFWNPGELGDGFYKLGDRDSRIPQIRNALNLALAKSELPILNSIESLDFDLDMSQKVFVLQSRYDLAQDSQIGNETNLLINELIRPDQTPVLRNRR